MADGKVTSIKAVQRTPVKGYTPYTENLSKVLPDWYSTADSHRFTKTVLTLNSKVEQHSLHRRAALQLALPRRAPHASLASNQVFIEATEFGDVLATSGLTYLQGVEVPDEMSFELDSTCGQAWTLTYYMTLLDKAPPKPQKVPAGSDEGLPFASPWDEAQWLHSWTWRRYGGKEGGLEQGDECSPRFTSVLALCFVQPLHYSSLSPPPPASIQQRSLCW